MGSAAVVKVDRASEQLASRRAALYRRSFAQDRSARRQREATVQSGSGARLEAVVILYLAFIWPSARFVPRRGLRSVTDRVPSRSARVVVRRAAGKTRVEQRAGAPHSTPTIHSEQLRGTLSRTTVAVPVRLTALQVLGVLAQPNQLRPAVVAVLLKGSGSSPQHQSQRACPWVMSLLARAPRLLFPPNLSFPHPHPPVLHRAVPPSLSISVRCSVLPRCAESTAARRSSCHPTTGLLKDTLSRTLAAAPIGLRGTLEPSTSPAIRARSPAPEPPALECAPPQIIPLHPLHFACTGRTTHSLPRCLSALPHPFSAAAQRLSLPAHSSQTRLPPSASAPAFVFHHGAWSHIRPDPQCSDVVALLRSPKPAQ